MSLTTRHGASERQAAATPLPLVVSGAVAGAAAGLLSYLALAVVALGAWMLDPAGAQEWSQMLEAASGAWLAGLGLAPTVDGVTITLLPIGFAVLPIVGLVSAGRWAAEASAVARRGEAIAVGVAAALAFGAVAAGLAALARSLSIPVTQSFILCSLTGFVVVSLAVLHRAGLLAWGRGLRDPHRLPGPLRAALAGAAVALCALVALSATLLAAAVIMNVDSVHTLLVELDPGVSGAVLLAALTLGYLPTAIVWTMAYAIGPGITISAGTTLSAYAAPSSATLPGFPLLAALPQTAPAGAAFLPIMVVAAGALAGVVLRRRGLSGLRGASAAAQVAVLAGSSIAVLGWLASGSWGASSLIGLGPSPIWVGLVGGALIGIGALLIAAWPGRKNDG